MTEVPSYIETMRTEHADRQREIEQLEAELRTKRQKLSALGRALLAVDPQWAAEHKPKPKGKGKGHTAYRQDGGYAVSEEKVEAVAAYIAEHFKKDDQTFAAKDIPLDAIGMSEPTRNAALKVLQETGRIRLDRLAGAAKIYATTNTN